MDGAWILHAVTVSLQYCSTGMAKFFKEKAEKDVCVVWLPAGPSCSID